MPQFIIFVRATSKTESEDKPDASELQIMGAYNDTLREAEGLHNSSRFGKRIAFHDSGAPTIRSGPFPANELIAGLWIVEVEDLDEAVAWAVKAPFKEGMVTEVRKIAKMGDFEDEKGGEL